MDEVVHVKLKGRKKFIKDIDEVTKHVSLLNKELKKTNHLLNKMIDLQRLA